ncbi:hypothetical protein [Streptomyces olivaceus]
MTKSGANGPKSRARARKKRTDSKYTQARRGAPAADGDRREVREVAVGTEVTVMTFRKGEPLPRTAPVISWECHRCGAATDICALTTDAGEGHMRPYCSVCLPPPDLFPARRAFADKLRSLQMWADWPSVEDLAQQVEALTGYSGLEATVGNVLSGAVLTRWDTVRALVHALGGDEDDVRDVLSLWQAAEQEQSRGPEEALTALVRQGRRTGLPARRDFPLHRLSDFD